MRKTFNELKLSPELAAELHLRGYHTLDDLKVLTTQLLHRIPGMEGENWHKVADALGRPRS
jgi:hypothetical protein